MIILKNNRHWIKFLINAFFFNYIFGGLDQIPKVPIPLDHIQHNQLNHFPFLPNIQQDYYEKKITFDGSLPISLNSYQFFDNIFLNKVDSILESDSYFSYRQGDYLYRDLILNKSVILDENLNIDFTGQKRSFPGPFSNISVSSDNSLQNYYLSIENINNNKSVISLKYFYHKENFILPIYLENRNQIHESNNVSFSAKKYHNKYILNSNISFQNGNLKINNYNLDYITIWSHLEYNKILNENLCIDLMYNGKKNNYEFKNNNNNNNNKDDLSIGVKFKKNKINFDFRFKLLNNNRFIYFNADYVSSLINFKIYLEPRNFFNMQNLFSDTITYISKNIEFYGLSLVINKYKYNISNKLSFHYVGYKSNLYFNYLYSIYEFSYRKISLDFKNFTSLFNDINQNYSNLKLKFSPIINWDSLKFLKNIPLFGIIFYNSEKRYNPFCFVELNHFNWVKSGFNEIGYYEIAKLPKYQFYLNWGCGFDINNFRFSYKQNYLSDEYIDFSNNLDNNIPNYPLGNMSYFQIDWRFTD